MSKESRGKSLWLHFGEPHGNSLLGDLPCGFTSRQPRTVHVDILLHHCSECVASDSAGVSVISREYPQSAS